MRFDLIDKDKLKVDMINYMNTMVKNFPIKYNLNKTMPYPATRDFFDVGDSGYLRKYKV